MRAGAILLCAGRGERLGAGADKALVPLAGRPLFAWSLEALERCAAVARHRDRGPGAHAAGRLAADRASPRQGRGVVRRRRRAPGVGRARLRALPAGFDLVAVHDAARALVTPGLIARVRGRRDRSTARRSPRCRSRTRSSG